MTTRQDADFILEGVAERVERDYMPKHPIKDPTAYMLIGAATSAYEKTGDVRYMYFAVVMYVVFNFAMRFNAQMQAARNHRQAASGTVVNNVIEEGKENA